MLNIDDGRWQVMFVHKVPSQGSSFSVNSSSSVEPRSREEFDLTHTPVTIMIITIILQSFILSYLIILVIPGKDRERRMVTESHDIRFSLQFDGSEEFRMEWVLSAGETEVLPDENPEFVLYKSSELQTGDI